MSSNRWLLFILGLFLLACNNRHHKVSRGFYYWRTTYAPGAYEIQRLNELKCSRLYLRCFDVDWDPQAGKPRPLAVVRLEQAPDRHFTYVPVVFITQKTMAAIRPQQVPQLAADIAQLLGQLSKDRFPFRELQVDCDWTRTSRAAYFSLLRALKQQALFRNCLLSCTIRLHQVRFSAGSGIPPADKGLLMCYNLGDLKRPGPHNSILDAGLAKHYLRDVNSYPLSLDIALPLFRWCVQFRDGRMKGILRDLDPAQLAASPLFTHLQANLYRSLSDTVWQGYDFRKGDEIRAELPGMDDLRETADYTARQLRNDSLTVLFFHADSLTLSHYSTDELETIYHHYD